MNTPLVPSSSRTPTREMPRPVHFLEDAEASKLYQPGGFQPVHLHDRLNNGRYEVIRKLGHGNFSTVWLAREHQAEQANVSSFVAITLAIADSTRATKETQVHRILLLFERQARAHVVKMLDCFELAGPNGAHLCLVIPALGPDLSFAIGGLDRCGGRLPYRASRRVIKHILLGLHRVHENRIVYSDMNLGNVLLTIAKEPAAKENSIDDYRYARGYVDGPPSRHIHEFIWEDRPQSEHADAPANVRFKLAGLGTAYPFDEPPSYPEMCGAHREPELLLGSTFDHRIVSGASAASSLNF